MTVSVVRFTVAGQDLAMAGQANAPTLRDESDRPYTVVYDGHCKVCGRLVKLLRWWDSGEKLEIVTSQAPGVQARFPWIPSRSYLESVQVIGPGGRTWQGAAATERLLNVLPKGKLLSWVFNLPFARAVAERFYRWFARNRYKLGCGKHCSYRDADLSYEENEATGIQNA